MFGSRCLNESNNSLFKKKEEKKGKVLLVCKTGGRGLKSKATHVIYYTKESYVSCACIVVLTWIV